MRGLVVAIRWVTHPVTVLAAVLLLINDHVAKGWWPGPATGIASDVAGLVVAPALLSLLCGVVAPRWSPRVVSTAALLVTGVGFALVKLTTTGAAVASAAWSVVAGPSSVLRDPTDLFALPALGLAWWAWRASWCRQAQGCTGPNTELAAGRVRALVVLPLMLLAVAATSAPAEPPAVTTVNEFQGRVVVAGTFAPVVATNADLDRWRPLTAEERETYHPPDTVQGRQLRVDCVPGSPRHCYRVRGTTLDPYVDGVPRGGRVLGVDQTTDGGRTWRTAWEIPAGRWLFLARQHDLFRNRDDHLLASVDILVRRVDGGHQLVVANGVDGLAVRDPDGTWRRVAVRGFARGPAVAPSATRRPSPSTPSLSEPSAAPPTPGGESPSVPGASATSGASSSVPAAVEYDRSRRVTAAPAPLTSVGVGLAAEIAVSTLVMLLGWLVASAVTAWRIRRVRPTSAIVWPLLTTTALVCSIPGFGALAFFDAVPMSLLAAGSVAAVALITAITQPDLPRPRAVRVAVATVLAGVAYLVPYLGWTLGVPQEHGTATLLAWLLGGAGLVGTGAVAWWAAARVLTGWPTAGGPIVPPTTGPATEIGRG